MRKVKTKWVINLPKGSEAKVRVGEMVISGQILAEEGVVREVVVSMVESLRGWSLADLNKMESELMGKEIWSGKLMYQTRGIFPKKIWAPGTGVVFKIDEFKNLYLRWQVDEKSVIKSPTEAKVVSVKDECLELEFRADEFEGVGLNNDRAWAMNGLKWVSNLNEISFADEGKIMATQILSPEMLVKAEVVGIKGVVVFESCKLNNKIPILQLKETDLPDLMVEMNKSRRALLNAGSGRLLLVI